MKRAALLLVPLALVAAEGPSRASAQSRPGGASASPPRPKVFGPRRLPPPPPPREATTTVIKVDTSTHEVDLARLPAAQAPAEAADAVPPLPAEGARTEPRELRVVDVGAAAPGARAASRGRGEVADPWSGGTAGSAGPRRRAVRVEGASEGLTAVAWGTGLPGAATVASSCDPSLVGRSGAMQALRWQHLSRRDDGTYRLINASGWLDRGACRLVQGPSAEAPLAVVASFEGQPMVLAARAGDRLLVVTPQLQNLHPAEPSRGRSSTGLIALSLVKPQRGGAVTVSGELPQSAWSQWRSGLSGVTTPPAPLPSIALRLDVSQAIGEPTPLALVTVQRPTAQEQRPVTAAAQGLSRTPPRPRASAALRDGLGDPFD